MKRLAAILWTLAFVALAPTGVWAQTQAVDASMTLVVEGQLSVVKISDLTFPQAFPGDSIQNDASAIWEITATQGVDLQMTFTALPATLTGQVSAALVDVVYAESNDLTQGCYTENGTAAPVTFACASGFTVAGADNDGNPFQTLLKAAAVIDATDPPDTYDGIVTLEVTIL